MQSKRFLVDAISTALSLGLATPDDVMRHVSADVFAEHLPRPLWAKLISTALSATRFDSRMVVDTIGVPTLCEHIPSHLLWACIVEFAQRALGHQGAPAQRVHTAVAPTNIASGGHKASTGSTMAEADPPRTRATAATKDATQEPTKNGESISDLAASLSDVLDDASIESQHNSRQPTRPPPRAGLSTRMGASSRKPQSLAPNGGTGRINSTTTPTPVRRGQTEMESPDADFAELSTRVADESNVVDNDAIEDEQLVDWQPS
jgi:hypothetical protein